MPQAYCSWCYHETRHTLEEKNYLRRNRYRCTRCSNTTYECRACSHMARGGKSWDDELCAEHAGELPEFRKIGYQFSSIDEASRLFQGASASAKVAAALTSKRLTRLISGCVDDFRVNRHRRGTSQHGVIFINGFLSQGNACNQDWAEHLGSAGYSHDSWFRVHWESCRIDELLKSGAKSSASTAPRLGDPDSRIGALSSLLSSIPATGALHWYTALLKAEITGRLLGISISCTPGWTFTLIGHSLGARVIHSALTTLTHIAPDDKRVERAILLGGAVDCTEDAGWDRALQAVKGHLDNGISHNDATLQLMYQSSLLRRSRPVGLNKIHSSQRRARNFDCSDLVSGHTEWKPNLDKVLARMNQPPASIFKNTFSAGTQRPQTI